MSAQAKATFSFLFPVHATNLSSGAALISPGTPLTLFANGILVQPRGSRVWNNTCRYCVSFNDVRLVF